MTAYACVSLSPTSPLTRRFLAKSPSLNVGVPILIVVAVTPGPTGPVFTVPGFAGVPGAVLAPPPGAYGVADRALWGSLPSLTACSISFFVSGLPSAPVGTGTGVPDADGS